MSGNAGPALKTKARRSKTSLGFMSLALLMSTAALVVSGLAYVRAGQDDTTIRGADMTPGPTSSSVLETPAASASETPADPSAEGELPAPGASYTLSRDGIELTLNGSRYVDFDQPLVNATDTAVDATFRASTVGNPSLDFNSTSVALGKSAAATPGECAEAIQLRPAEQKIDLSPDLTICAVTDGDGAVNDPGRQKIARIVVGPVADDGTTTLKLTTWEIPN